MTQTAVSVATRAARRHRCWLAARAWAWRMLVGEIRDQAHLYGLLDRLRDFGIDLVAVEPEVGSPHPESA